MNGENERKHKRYMVSEESNSKSTTKRYLPYKTPDQIRNEVIAAYSAISQYNVTVKV
jgi:hypothetical protein